MWASFAHAHSDAILPRGDFILPSQASDMGNASLAYQRKGFSSRVSFNFQGSLPLAIGATIGVKLNF